MTRRWISPDEARLLARKLAHRQPPVNRFGELLAACCGLVLAGFVVWIFIVAFPWSLSMFLFPTLWWPWGQRKG